MTIQQLSKFRSNMGRMIEPRKTKSGKVVHLCLACADFLAERPYRAIADTETGERYWHWAGDNRIGHCDLCAVLDGMRSDLEVVLLDGNGKKLSKTG